MADGIRISDVQYADADKQHIRSIRLAFGDGHELELTEDDHEGMRLKLHGAVTIVLSTGEPRCQFERAVNLLSLHMPAARAER